MHVCSRRTRVAQPGHGRSSRIARLCTITVVLGLSIPACASNRIPDGPPLQLHRGEFTYNSPAKQPVYDWFNLDPAFVAVLERHPSALEEGRKATPFRTVAIVSTVGTSVFGLKAVLTSLESADNLTSNDVESVESDLAIMTGFAILTTVFDVFARRYVRRAVSLFNVEEMGRGSAAGEPHLFRSAVGNLEIAPAYHLGRSLGLVARSRVHVP